MINLRHLPGEGTALYSPIGLRPIDEATGREPFGRLYARLDRSDGGAGWLPVDINTVTTPTGILTYPGLERRRVVAAQPARQYRVSLTAEFYRPLYRATTDGIVFNAFPYNDTNPPQTITKLPQDVILIPMPNYPFPTHIPILHGLVTDLLTGEAVEDAMVIQGVTQRALTDERGAFALMLPRTPINAPVPVDAINHRNGRTGTITITLPHDLGQSHTITIS